MFSIGGSRTSAPFLGLNKDRLVASNRQLSNMPPRYNHSKQFPDFKYNPPHQIDVPQQPRAKTKQKKSPSKTEQKSRMMTEAIDEVGLDASLAEAVPQTPDTSTGYSTCPLTIKLTDFLTSSFGCVPQKSSISPKVTASPKSSSASPIEFLHFSWFATPRKTTMPCDFRKRLSSDCQSEDSFVVFGNDDDDCGDLDSDCFMEDDGSDGDDDEESCGETYHDVGHMAEDSVDTKIGKKKVTFEARDKLCIIHRMVTWSFAYRFARKGHWEELGRDRTRFTDRIKNIAPTLSKILSSEHRNKIYHQRFE